LLYANGNPINGTDPTGLATLQEYQIAFAIAAIPVTTATFAPSIIAGARDRNTSDDVVVYTGMGTVIPLTGLFGHAFVEIDGEIYTFPPSEYLPDPAPRDVYLQKEQEKYGYEYNRYSINYNSKEKQTLKSNLINNRNNNFRDKSDYNFISANCTSYVTASLPSISMLFDVFVKPQFDPSMLGWGLDIMGATQRNLVNRLSPIQRLPGTQWRFG
jgi:hypothetical protein